MLFMGEEYAASTPFLYFCDFAGDLAKAVTAGRRREFGRFERFADPAVQSSIPDPNAEASFRRSKLQWGERVHGAHAEWLAFVTQLLATRQQALWPWLAQARSGHFNVSGAGLLQVNWPLGESGALHLLANLDQAAAKGAAWPDGEVLFDSHASAVAERPAWSVRVSLVAP
jgi:maltooligosyltrehalose trehalohydrolase